MHYFKVFIIIFFSKTSFWRAANSKGNVSKNQKNITRHQMEELVEEKVLQNDCKIPCDHITRGLVSNESF